MTRNPRHLLPCLASVPILLVLSLFAHAIVPWDFVKRESCTGIELNHYFDGNGKAVFSQVVFHDWNAEKSRHDVRDFRMVRCNGMEPHYRQGEWRLVWHDPSSGDVLREVSAGWYRESFTQTDPELEQRAVFPKEARRGLKR